VNEADVCNGAIHNNISTCQFIIKMNAPSRSIVALSLSSSGRNDEKEEVLLSLL
jgi:hypothetical protein